jgi:hypothetical protein
MNVKTNQLPPGDDLEISSPQNRAVFSNSLYIPRTGEI